MSRKIFVLLSVILILAVGLSACGANSSQRATMTAMAVDNNKMSTQVADLNTSLASANASLTSANGQLAEVNAKLAEANTKLGQSETKLSQVNSQLNDANLRISTLEALVTPIYGKWVDEVGDSWEFKAGDALHAVAGGKNFDTTWKTVDLDTIIIDFGPILTSAGDPNAVLTLGYTIVGDKLTLKFANGQEVPLTRVK